MGHFAIIDSATTV